MPHSALSIQLMDLRDILLSHVQLGDPPNDMACRRYAARLDRLSRQAAQQERRAEQLEARAIEADVMQAVVDDLNMLAIAQAELARQDAESRGQLIAHARSGQIGAPDQETLRREQAALQARLDAEDAAGAAHVARPAAGRIIAFPPRRPALAPQHDGDGDAA